MNKEGGDLVETVENKGVAPHYDGHSVVPKGQAVGGGE